jgi:hypothetical protein
MPSAAITSLGVWQHQVGPDEGNPQGARPAPVFSERQHGVASRTKAARIMISLLIVGPVRLITHRESLFPIPASPDGAAPTNRGHADPTDRIAKRFCQRLALVVEVSLLGDLIEIEGIGIGLVREQPATAARWPAALLETKIPISPSRCSPRDKPQNEMRFVAAHGRLAPNNDIPS